MPFGGSSNGFGGGRDRGGSGGGGRFGDRGGKFRMIYELFQ